MSLISQLINAMGIDFSKDSFYKNREALDLSGLQGKFKSMIAVFGNGDTKGRENLGGFFVGLGGGIEFLYFRGFIPWGKFNGSGIVFKLMKGVIFKAIGETIDDSATFELIKFKA